MKAIKSSSVFIINGRSTFAAVDATYNQFMDIQEYVRTEYQGRYHELCTQIIQTVMNYDKDMIKRVCPNGSGRYMNNRRLTFNIEGLFHAEGLIKGGIPLTPFSCLCDEQGRRTTDVIEWNGKFYPSELTEELMGKLKDIITDFKVSCVHPLTA